ncbi:hypothetical protein GH714_036775 [Hevea brasiliensis]|uniref:Uncharacterized protein n=1 Tax=Hevea brasiliensis TaxID=3981 RepID=A0A6A6KHI2_HEVBR|nr:hypothetical protein GH714_036775 [Hevea brasiliensis]
MGRAPCCDKANVKRGPWSPEEDATLKRYLETHGTGVIIMLQLVLLVRWSLIASQLPGRTDNDVKNYWNTKLKKKLSLEGKTSLAIKNNTEIITPAKNSTNSAPCSTPSLPCILPKTETNGSLTFWDSITQSSVTLPILSDVGYEPILNTAQSLCLDPVDQFSFPAGINMDVSELGANLINNQNKIVLSSQEGSSISDSSSIAMDHNKCLSLPSNGGTDLEHAGTMLIDSGFGFPYDPVNALLFEDKAGEVASTCCPNFGGFGYADIKHQQGQNQSVVNQY